MLTCVHSWPSTAPELTDCAVSVRLRVAVAVGDWMGLALGLGRDMLSEKEDGNVW